jgi:hypothetical protein
MKERDTPSVLVGIVFTLLFVLVVVIVLLIPDIW